MIRHFPTDEPSAPARTRRACLALAMIPVLLVGCTVDVEEPDASPTPAASTAPPSTAVEDFQDLAGFTSEYSDAATELSKTLPAGTSIPDLPTGEWDPEGHYEPGAGDMEAAFAWQCAWIRTYLDAKTHSDQETVDASLSNLKAWTELSLVRPHVDEESRRVWAEEVIEPAALGDDSFLLSIGANCTP